MNQPPKGRPVTQASALLADGSRRVKLSTADAERLIVELGRLRASMSPPVPIDLDQEASFAGVADPRWGVTASSETGTAILRVRDPRYGWLHYSLPLSSATKLAQALLQQATRAAPPVSDTGPSKDASSAGDC
jgi:hypothetical protein